MGQDGAGWGRGILQHEAPGPGAVRGALAEGRRARSSLRALLIFSGHAALYLASLAALVVAPWWYVKLVCVIANGSLISVLFVIGHDACHGSLTPSRRLNGLLGRLAFLPSLTPFTCWRYSHNHLHHTYTNWKEKDFVWRPLSLEEYRRLPAWRRALERCYRTPWGLPVNWVVENWWTWHLFPSRVLRREMRKWGPVTLDRALVMAFVPLLTVAAAALHIVALGSAGWWAAPLWAVAAPYVVWATLMSYIDLVHHTHPRIRWFKDKADWSFFGAQVGSTAHVVFPWPLGLLGLNIMEHTAHHVDPSVPLYNLPASQRDMERAFPEDIVVQPLTPSFVLSLFRTCQLYDYENQRWLDFHGNPTTPSLREPARHRPAAAA